IEFERLKEERVRQLKIKKQKELKYLKDNKKYHLNTDNVRYNLYDSSHFSFLTKKLYSAFIKETLWIKEPFYTAFYKILNMIDRDTLMIRDFNSQVIILNIRDENGNDTVSESFEVISSKEYLANTVIYCEKTIKKFNKNDAQCIILAISFIVFKKSIHFQNTSLNDIIDEVFQDEKYFKKVQDVISFIESNNEQVSFINDALISVYKTLERYPYNTSERVNNVVIPNLKHKMLLHL
ncbi:MAG: hypothetical protein U9N59_10200, partial [Campylobacterota bacterium]|nr:hypothetical protein [Campylobacterota bacterium]